MKTGTILCLLLSFCSVCFSQKQSIPKARWALVKQYLESRKDFSGMVQVAEGGVVKFSRGYGFADREKKVRYTENTLSTIGSITKPFTATAIMLLLEQGKLAVKDPISKYFPNVPEDKKGITLHHLLTHSAGFPGAIGDDYEAISKEDFVKLAMETSLLFAPGTAYEYTNVGYSLLGMVVEQLSGMSYDAFLQKNVFEPAGMKTAGYDNPAADYKLLTHGYLADGSDWGTSKSKPWNGKEPYWHLKANGGLLMSARDMTQWYRALRSNKVLKPETLKLQTSPHVDEGGGTFYGYGYSIANGGKSIEHNGGNGIFRADFRWFPELDLCLFASSNDANVRLFRLDDEIIRILMSGELPGQTNWQPVPMNEFPANERQETAQAMLTVLTDYSAEAAAAFVEKYCSPGIVERNGKERMTGLFQMLSKDTGGNEVQAVYESDNQIQLAIPAREEGAKLKIFLTFLGNQVDKLQAEMEGN